MVERRDGGGERGRQKREENDKAADSLPGSMGKEGQAEIGNS